MTYFLLWYRLDNQDGYLIWVTADADTSVDDPDKDRVLVGKTGKLHVFSHTSQAIEYAKLSGLKIQDDTTILHNLDIVQAWLNAPSSDNVNCNDFLSAWNLFTDVSNSIAGQDFIVNTPLIDRIYDKLFWGNNLPAVTPVGAHYEPIWSSKETRQLKRVLQTGLQLFITGLKST